MVRTPDAGLATHFGEETTSLARLLTITRIDNVRILLTDHDADITVPSRALAATTGTDTDDTITGLTLDDVPGGASVASGTLTITGGNNALNTETVTIGTRTYTFETVFSDTADFVLIGANRSATLLNLANAINNGPGEGTTYGTGTVIHADVTATPPNQTTVAGQLISQATGTVLGNMTNIDTTTGFGGTNEQAFDGITNQGRARSTNRQTQNGPGYIGKDYSGGPQAISQAIFYGTNNAAFHLPVGEASLRMTLELRAANGALPADPANSGTLLGTVGPFINPQIVAGQPIGAAGIKTVLSSDDVTTYDFVWGVLRDPRDPAGNYVIAEIEFYTPLITTGAGDMAVESKVVGFAQNLIATTETMTNGSFAAATLTGGADAQFNALDTETVTIDGKVYTFQTTLTNVDGNVQIGALAADSLQNLVHAINLTGTPGTDYAAATTIHPTVSATLSADDAVQLSAKTAGTGGNSIALSETLSNGSWSTLLLIGGEDGIYLSVPGFLASSSLSSSQQGIEGVQIDTIEGAGGLTQTAIVAGLFNEAQCVLEYVNWETVSDGFMILFAGIMGTVNNTDESELNFEIQGRFSKSRSVRINTYQPSCRADLGDSDCQYDINEDRENFTVTVVNSATSFETGTLTQADDFWKLGVVHWLTGNNAGIAIEVSSSVSVDGEIVLFLPTPLDIEVGDTGEIWPGCDKTIQTCIQRYANVVNFRGEPFAPQEGALFAFKG